MKAEITIKGSIEEIQNILNSQNQILNTVELIPLTKLIRNETSFSLIESKHLADKILDKFNLRHFR